MPARPFSRHRGFDLRLRTGTPGAFAFEVSHFGLALHASSADYRSVHSAERAARQFVDDALGAFSHATAAITA